VGWEHKPQHRCLEAVPDVVKERLGGLSDRVTVLAGDEFTIHQKGSDTRGGGGCGGWGGGGVIALIPLISEEFLHKRGQ